MTKRKASPAQLAALKKGREALKRKRAGKKPKAARKSRPVVKKRKKSVKPVVKKRATKTRTRSKSRPKSGNFIYATVPGTSARYYLQQLGSGWVLKTGRPASMSGPTLQHAIAAIKKMRARLPKGAKVFLIESKKK